MWSSCWKKHSACCAGHTSTGEAAGCGSPATISAALRLVTRDTDKGGKSGVSPNCFQGHSGLGGDQGSRKLSYRRLQLAAAHSPCRAQAGRLSAQEAFPRWLPPRPPWPPPPPPMPRHPPPPSPPPPLLLQSAPPPRPTPPPPAPPPPPPLPPPPPPPSSAPPPPPFPPPKTPQDPHTAFAQSPLARLPAPCPHGAQLWPRPWVLWAPGLFPLIPAPLPTGCRV